MHKERPKLSSACAVCFTGGLMLLMSAFQGGCPIACLLYLDLSHTHTHVGMFVCVWVCSLMHAGVRMCGTRASTCVCDLDGAISVCQ